MHTRGPVSRRLKTSIAEARTQRYYHTDRVLSCPGPEPQNRFRNSTSALFRVLVGPDSKKVHTSTRAFRTRYIRLVYLFLLDDWT